MTDIRIPEEYQRGFVEMRRLTEQQAQGLVSVLKGEPPTLNRENLRSGIASKMSDIARSDVDEIIDTLASLYALRSSMGLKTVEFAGVVCDAMDESGAEELEFGDGEDGERELFKTRLIQLLEVDSLNVAMKANDLLYEQEHAVHGSLRVITDIRPVFGDDPEEDPVGTVLVHMLKISYHDGRRIEDFFVTLDTEQVDELIGVLGRASLKAESLKRMLAGTKVPYLGGE